MSEEMRSAAKAFDAAGLVRPYLKVAGDLGVGSYAVKMEDAEYIARLAFHEGMMAAAEGYHQPIPPSAGTKIVPPPKRP